MYATRRMEERAWVLVEGDPPANPENGEIIVPDIDRLPDERLNQYTIVNPRLLFDELERRREQNVELWDKQREEAVGEEVLAAWDAAEAEAGCPTEPAPPAEPAIEPAATAAPADFAERMKTARIAKASAKGK